MPQYASVTIEVKTDKGPVKLNLHTCVECGALVGDRTRHTTFHVNVLGQMVAATDPRSIAAIAGVRDGR